MEDCVLPKIACGDESAVDECLERYGGLVWSVARRFCARTDEAEDATQEIFVEIWQKASAYKPERASEATFIMTIARRRLIDHLRRNRRIQSNVSLSTDAIEIPDIPESDPAELSDEAEKARACMQKLSAAQQSVIALTIHHGLSQASTAERLKMPLGTVKSYARRALLQLRDCMSRRRLSSAEVGVT